MTPNDDATQPADEAGTLTRVPTWGYTLLDGLTRFLLQSLEAGTPMSTKIVCNFPDMPDTPVLYLWATTDSQTPEARISVVCEERELARLDTQKAVERCAALARRLAAAEASNARMREGCHAALRWLSVAAVPPAMAVLRKALAADAGEGPTPAS